MSVARVIVGEVNREVSEKHTNYNRRSFGESDSEAEIKIFKKWENEC